MHPHRSRRSVPIAARLAAAMLLVLPLGGCAAAYMIGAMGQAFEDQKLIEVDAQYKGLTGKTVAVIVNCGLDVRYEYNEVPGWLTGGMSREIGLNVPDVRILDPNRVMAWQARTPQWDAMSYGEVAEALGVDRVIWVDIFEFRLHPPGNRWLWDGAVGAAVGIVERDGFDVDSFVDVFDVSVTYPDIEGLDRASASRDQIYRGLVSKFGTEASRLFFKHTRPKYPDRYNAALEQ